MEREAAVCMDEFLTRHGMHPRGIDLHRCLLDYLEEMNRGLREPNGTLLMLPTYIGFDRPLVRNRRVVAMDAGGTNLRIAFCATDDAGRVTVHSHTHSPMPGCGEAIGQEAFFRRLAQRLYPYADACRDICVSFAYPAQATPEWDGRIIRMSKEMRVEGIEGRLFGENLKKALHDIGLPGCRIRMTNDTVATALAGISQQLEASGYVGLVLGTGVNTCYGERTANIQKPFVKGQSKTMLINVESGNYANQPRGDLDVSFDQSTQNPHEQTLEKMISGAYLGRLVLHVLKASAQENLFSHAFYQALNEVESLATRDLTGFLCGDWGMLSGCCARERDAALLNDLICALIVRAAKLTALQVAGAAVKTGAQSETSKPLCVCAEGSVYHGLPGIKEGIDQALPSMINQRDMHVDIIRVQHAVIKGASVLRLMDP